MLYWAQPNPRWFYNMRGTIRTYSNNLIYWSLRKRSFLLRLTPDDLVFVKSSALMKSLRSAIIFTFGSSPTFYFRLCIPQGNLYADGYSAFTIMISEAVHQTKIINDTLAWINKNGRQSSKGSPFTMHRRDFKNYILESKDENHTLYVGMSRIPIRTTILHLE